MLDVLLIEFLKLRRSLVLLLCIAAPVFVAIICFLLLLDAGNRGLEWDRFLASGSAMWAYFMLPMSVTAITVLVAQVEHGPKAWNFLLSQPVPRWQIFAAKLIVVLILLAAMSVALYGLLYGAGFLSQAVLPSQRLGGSPNFALSAKTLAMMYAGALMMIAIQLWIALRFRSFVPPIIVGIGGTFSAIAASAVQLGVVFPWLIPVNALAANPDRREAAITFGVVGGLCVIALMLWRMSRYEAP